MIRTNLLEDFTLVPLPPWWQSPWAVAGLVLLVVLIGVLVWVLQRWLGSRPPPAPAAIPVPDRTPEFLARLAALRGQRERLGAHDFAIECSDVLREFVEWRFRLAIRFQTTREFLEAAARDAVLRGPQRESLGNYLRFCDLVKFARQGATLEEEARLIDAAETFVRQGGGR